MILNIILWVLQGLMAAFFLFHTYLKFAVPQDLPPLMSWLYDLSQPMLILIGVAEFLGALGLILPGLTGARPRLTVYAALGLAAIMGLAIIWHVPRGEVESIGTNVVVGLILLFIAYGRARLRPHRDRSITKKQPGAAAE